MNKKNLNCDGENVKEFTKRNYEKDFWRSSVRILWKSSIVQHFSPWPLTLFCIESFTESNRKSSTTSESKIDSKSIQFYSPDSLYLLHSADLTFFLFRMRPQKKRCALSLLVSNLAADLSLRVKKPSEDGGCSAPRDVGGKVILLSRPQHADRYPQRHVPLRRSPRLLPAQDPARVPRRVYTQVRAR